MKTYTIDNVAIDETQIKQLLKEHPELLEVSKGGRWKPEKNEVYYHLDSCGKIFVDQWKDTDPHNFRYSQGNVFKTEEEAQAHLDYLNALGRIRLAIEEGNDGWEADWSDDGQVKYDLHLDYYSKKWVAFSRYCNFSGVIGAYAKSENILHKIIKTHSADLEIIRKYVMGV